MNAPVTICQSCEAPQEPDSNFCDQCGAEIYRKPAAVKLEIFPKESGWTEVFWTQDIGEHALMRSLLQNENIPVFSPDELSQHASLLTNPFFRTFTLAVPWSEEGRAKRLLKNYNSPAPDTEFSSSKSRIALILLFAFVTALVFGIWMQALG